MPGKSGSNVNVSGRLTALNAGERSACQICRRLRCPDIAARQDTAEARHTELLALMERSGVGAVNTFVYGPDLKNVEAELRALQQTAAEKNCPANITKAPGKPEPGMGPIH